MNNIQYIVTYPEGQYTDSEGNVHNNAELAYDLLEELLEGRSAIIPREYTVQVVYLDKELSLQYLNKEYNQIIKDEK